LTDLRARRERFRAVYDANYHRILGFALRRVQAADAADVVAETFLVAWRRLDEVPEGEAARLWLYGTARRVLANHARAARRRERLAARLDELPEPPDDPTAGSDELGVAAALARLRPADRELLALAAWEELAPAEIAVVLGRSAGAVRIGLLRARRRLARELGADQAPAVRRMVLDIEEAS
jgi:RNA polymerase sigma-70 factor (ECF subfamily)